MEIEKDTSTRRDRHRGSDHLKHQPGQLRRHLGRFVLLSILAAYPLSAASQKISVSILTVIYGETSKYGESKLIMYIAAVSGSH